MAAFLSSGKSRKVRPGPLLLADSPTLDSPAGSILPGYDEAQMFRAVVRDARSFAGAALDVAELGRPCGPPIVTPATPSPAPRRPRRRCRVRHTARSRRSSGDRARRAPPRHRISSVPPSRNCAGADAGASGERPQPCTPVRSRVDTNQSCTDRPASVVDPRGDSFRAGCRPPTASFGSRPGRRHVRFRRPPARTGTRLSGARGTALRRSAPSVPARRLAHSHDELSCASPACTVSARRSCQCRTAAWP